MRLKGMLGFCECKGCRSKYVFNIELRKGKKREKRKVCRKHMAEIIKATMNGWVTIKAQVCRKDLEDHIGF